MSKPIVTVKACFCRSGLTEVYSQVFDGSLPLSILCGDGVGQCTIVGQEHSALCLSKFMAMNFKVELSELIHVLEKTLKSRNVPTEELARIIQLCPELEPTLLNNSKSWPILKLRGSEWVKAFLNMEVTYFNNNCLELPIQYASCLTNYTNYLNCKKAGRCCKRPYCPVERTCNTILKIEKLPNEIIYHILSFIYYN